MAESTWAKNKARTLRSVEKRRRELIRALAPDGRCAKCGRKPWKHPMEIDHVDRITWKMNRVNRWTRIARCWREFQAGVRLRALCRRCNARAWRKQA